MFVWFGLRCLVWCELWVWRTWLTWLVGLVLGFAVLWFWCCGVSCLGLCFDLCCCLLGWVGCWFTTEVCCLDCFWIWLFDSLLWVLASMAGLLVSLMWFGLKLGWVFAD